MADNYSQNDTSQVNQSDEFSSKNNFDSLPEEKSELESSNEISMTSALVSEEKSSTNTFELSSAEEFENSLDAKLESIQDSTIKETLAKTEDRFTSKELSRQVQKLKNELKDQKCKFNDKYAQLENAWKEKNKKAQRKIKLMKSEFERTKADYEYKIEIIQNKKNVEKTTMTETIEKLEADARKAQIKIERVNDDLKSVKQKLNRSQKQIKKEQEESIKLHKYIEDLTQEQTGRLENTRVNFEAQIEKLSEENNRLNQKNIDLTDNALDIKKKFFAENSKYCVEKERKEEVLFDLEIAQSKAEALQEKLANFEIQITQAKHEIIAAESQNKLKNEHIKQLESDFVLLDSEKQELERRLYNIDATNEAFQNKMDSFRKEYEFRIRSA